MIATKEKMVDLRVKPSGASCIEIELSNKRIFRHNKHYNAYILDFKQASLLARRLLQVPAVGHKIAEQLTWTPYRIKPKGIVNAPKANGLYLVTMKYKDNLYPITYILYYDAHLKYWVDTWGENYEETGAVVYAWRTLPAPYGEIKER